MGRQRGLGDLPGPGSVSHSVGMAFGVTISVGMTAKIEARTHV